MPDKFLERTMIETTKLMIAEHERLDAIAMDSFFEKIDALTGDGSFVEGVTPLTINLSDVKFVDPYGLVCLSLIVKHLQSRCAIVNVILPDDIVCQSYLRKMNFLHEIEGRTNVQNESTFRTVQNLGPDVLLELTKIDSGANSSREDINNILERLNPILQNELNFGDKEISNLTTIITELCHNIKDHSGDEGLVAVQRYQRKNDGKRFVMIAVGDLGIGIRNRLGTRFDVSEWSHLDAIIQALKKDVSALPDRGFGLYMVSKITKDYGGSLHIRSGDYRLYLRRDPRGVQTVHFPGTQVCISLSELNNN